MREESRLRAEKSLLDGRPRLLGNTFDTSSVVQKSMSRTAGDDTDASALLDSQDVSSFSLTDKKTMMNLMQKLNYVQEHVSARHGLALGLA